MNPEQNPNSELHTLPHSKPMAVLGILRPRASREEGEVDFRQTSVANTVAMNSAQFSY